MQEQDFNMGWVREPTPDLRDQLEKRLSRTFPVIFEDLIIGSGTRESFRLRYLMLELSTHRWIFAQNPEDIIEAASGDYHVMGMLNYMEVTFRDPDNDQITRGFAFGRIPSMERPLYKQTLPRLLDSTNHLLQEIGLSPFPPYK